MINVTPEYLLTIVNAETVKKIWRGMKGCRVYFGKCKIEHYEIKEVYNKQIKQGIPRNKAIDNISVLYEIDTQTVKYILAKQQELFDDNI